MNIELKVLNKEFYQADVDSVMEHESCSYEEAMNLKEGTLDYSLLPSYATAGAAGMDLRITHDITLAGGEAYLAGTGIAIHISSAFPYCGIANNMAGFIFPRSGLGHKLGVILGNGTGVIDEDYQGEIKLSLWNRSDTLVKLNAGDRVAQLIFVPIIKAQWSIVNEFSNSTERGGNGYGSTGINK